MYLTNLRGITARRNMGQGAGKRGTLTGTVGAAGAVGVFGGGRPRGLRGRPGKVLIADQVAVHDGRGDAGVAGPRGNRSLCRVVHLQGCVGLLKSALCSGGRFAFIGLARMLRQQSLCGRTQLIQRYTLEVSEA